MAYGKRYRKRTTKRSSVRKSPFKRVNTKALAVKVKTRRLVKLIKGVQLKNSETCYRTYKNQSFTCYHNTIAKLSMWWPTIPVAQSLWPTQGNTDGNRQGDEIITQGIMLRMQLNVPYDRRNAYFKVFYLQYNDAQGDPATRTDLLHDVTGSLPLDPIQTDRWPGIKYLGTYRPIARDLSTTTSQHSTILIKKWIPMAKKVLFNNDGSHVPSNVKSWGVILILPYSYTGALTTDIIAENCQATWTLYYKDP